MSHGAKLPFRQRSIVPGSQNVALDYFYTRLLRSVSVRRSPLVIAVGRGYNIASWLRVVVWLPIAEFAAGDRFRRGVRLFG